MDSMQKVSRCGTYSVLAEATARPWSIPRSMAPQSAASRWD